MSHWKEVQTAWAQAFIEGLHRAGLQTLLISPGARSTPLVAAALRSALTCKAILDERTAAFFALGQAKTTGVATGLLCTSGTAPAHYFPAVLEAYYSYTPLLIISADRPPELRNCGAPQTIDQMRLFGGHCRHFFDLGVPQRGQTALPAVSRMAAQAMHHTVAPISGPVHVNAPLRKPLSPIELRSSGEKSTTIPIRTFPASCIASDDGIAELVRSCQSAQRGVILAGPQPIRSNVHNALFRFVHATQFPLVCETASQLRFTSEPAPPTLCDAFPLFLQQESFRPQGNNAPDWILQIGAAPTHPSIHPYVVQTQCPRFVLRRHGWSDPNDTEHTIVFGDTAHTLEMLAQKVAPALQPQRAAWAQKFIQANNVAKQCILDELRTPHPQPTEGQMVSSVVNAAPSGTLLVLGNSNPIRLVDEYCLHSEKGLRILSQRGVNGIDGLIAGAAGAASVHEAPVILIVGDLSFAHDLSSLAVATTASWPLVVVVIDNHGGRIFEKLPIAQSDIPKDDFQQYWLTPQSIDPEQAAKLYDCKFYRTQTPASLRAVITQATQQTECSIVHAVVAPHGATQSWQRVTATWKTATHPLYNTHHGENHA